ncbi:helix-turn-helix domain-containing protein, partial [Leuconostoc citreum]|nr:helix-turn-helix domain-containing protein [Leuconostoc citreum]
MKYFKWRDKHIERVQELSRQGQTAKEIADTMFKEIGVNLSQRSIRHYTSSKENIEQVVVNDKRRGTEIVINKDGSETSSTVLQMTSEQAKDQDYVLRAHG